MAVEPLTASGARCRSGRRPRDAGTLRRAIESVIVAAGMWDGTRRRHLAKRARSIVTRRDGRRPCHGVRSIRLRVTPRPRLDALIETGLTIGVETPRFGTTGGRVSVLPCTTDASCHRLRGTADPGPRLGDVVGRLRRLLQPVDAAGGGAVSADGS